MKYIVGFIVVVLVLITTCYIALGFWGITLFDSQNLENSYKTLGLLFVVALVLVMAFAYFFKPVHKGYDTQKGNIAHPKQE